MNKEEYQKEERRRRIRQTLIDYSWGWQILGVLFGIYLAYWISWNVIIKWLIKLL